MIDIPEPDDHRPPTSPLPPGTPGEVLLQRMKDFDFAPEDLEEMSRAIEEADGESGQKEFTRSRNPP